MLSPLPSGDERLLASHPPWMTRSGVGRTLAHMKEFPDYYERLERMERDAECEWASRPSWGERSPYAGSGDFTHFGRCGFDLVGRRVKSPRETEGFP